MDRFCFRSILLAGAAVIGVAGLSQSASALIIANAGDFQVIESCNASLGCSGNFDVINNSNGDGNWYVYNFDVQNAFATSDATTQTNWSSCLSTSTASCTGDGGFDYSNNNGSSHAGADLLNDVGPGQSSNLFTFTTQIPASPVTLLLVNTDGLTTSVNIPASDVIPEPASLAVLGAGMFGLYGSRRRRRSRAGA